MTNQTSVISQQTAEKTINTTINNIKKAYAKGNVDIHECACMIIEHAKSFGNCDPAARLVNALPKTFRRALLAKWFTVYSPIILTVKKGEFKAHLAKDGSTAHKPFNVENAKSNPFYDMPEAQKDSDLFVIEDFVNGLSRLIGRAEGALKNNKVANDDIPSLTDNVDKVKSLLRSLKGETTLADVVKTDEATAVMERVAA
jgi:hypothetical protein